MCDINRHMIRKDWGVKETRLNLSGCVGGDRSWHENFEEKMIFRLHLERRIQNHQQGITMHSVVRL